MGFNNNDPVGNPGVAEPNPVERDSHRKYFLPRVDIKDYNVLIDGRNFYDQKFLMILKNMKN